MRYANVIIDISHEAVDRPFTYIVPDELVSQCHPGTKVSIPFGKGNSERMGVILALTDHPSVPVAKLKEISSVVLSQDATESRLIELAYYIKEQYGSTMIDALKLVLPAKKTYRKKAADKEPYSDEEADESCGMDIILNEEQMSVVTDFTGEYDRGVRKTYLIHGITGSGKTEVYIRLIHHVVSRGRQAIMLIPEIGLTYQTVKRFKRYFGERVAIMNSSLAAGERFAYYEKAKNRQIDVIIGPRSALFTPFPDVGIIIMDEEHEGTYKSETMPRFHARDVAIKLADMHGASVVLGSATPSVESYYHALNGDYGLFELSNRATGAMLPEVEIVDLRTELKAGNRTMFSNVLRQRLVETVSNGKQAMLFINRRGYAGFVSCRACGKVMKCPHCDVSLSEHRGKGILVCHYCGYEAPKPNNCPSCGSKYIMSFKAGTEQIEEGVKKILPGVRTLRMDGDTTTGKDSREKILKAFGEHKADVLIGTQMIVKGHDFADVTLVGVLAADISLASGDYRAGERTFELLTQAAGRAGRGSVPGKVVIQTYQPDHYSIVHAASQDYKAFYEEEILYRDIAGYPPIKEIMAVLISDKDEDAAYLAAVNLSGLCRAKGREVQIIGPGKAGIGKISDRHRYVFYIKADKKEDLIILKDDMEEWLDSGAGDSAIPVKVAFDFGPMNPF